MAVDSPEKPARARRPSNFLERAGHVLDRGDQWFATSAGKVFGWAERGSDHATHQTMATLASALGVKQDAKGQGIESLPPPSAELRGDAPEPGPVSFHSLDTSDLDLIWAEQVSDGATGEAPSRAPVNPGLTGLVPLVQALGRIVAQHAERKYVSLVGDERFWLLVDALHSLTSASPPGESEPHPEGAHSRQGPVVKGAR